MNLPFLQPLTAKTRLRVELLNTIQICKNELDPQPKVAKKKEAAQDGVMGQSTLGK